LHNNFETLVVGDILYIGRVEAIWAG
jgi:hypothetical protein